MAASDAPKNSAFVFVKPHAVTPAVVDLVKNKLAEAGITVLEDGVISAEQIDNDRLIDIHYYAIASKAVLKKPHELNVPADKFQNKFGIGWQEALDQGVVFNAIDGAAKLGLNAADLEKRWGVAKKAKDMIKFGGGFYCALIDGFYLFNGFFMSMRDKYVAPGKSIHWMSVEWDSSNLSWEDFRGKVLGPTDPSTGPADSARGTIFANWESLGLSAQPDTGDNGVHASASPFEALSERLNWLKADLASDPFGAQLLNAGVSASTIKAWGVDPQVCIDSNGTKGSLFDALEDINADVCLERCVNLVALNQPKNEAFVFVKPHAVNNDVVELVKSKLADAQITVTADGSISSEQIDSDRLIDNHYYAIASKAVLKKPHELNVPADKFQKQFGVGWQEALDQGVVFNAIDGAAKLGLNAADLEKRWAVAKKNKDMIKFGGGFYCAKIEDYYLFNGFFMSMRDKYVAPGKSIHWFTVEWDANALSWADFRGQVLGPTDPSTGPANSVRGTIYANWESLGLSAQPDTGDNGVHASASPFEALSERMNWLKADLKSDAFGKAMLDAGVPESTIQAWGVDPQVTVDAEGKKGSLFDALEDINADECLTKSVELVGFSKPLNEAFVFVKPHAVNNNVVELVKSKLADAQITVTADGSISAEQIDSDKLIDTHYYAIASKAVLKKPHELNVPADKFQKQFGVGWQEALDQGIVFNAIDGGAKLGLNAIQLEQKWRVAKKEKAMVKFGGGFYCARIEGLYLFNGFFMSMRDKYVAPGKSIHWFTVEWNSDDLSWEDFRGKVLGPTDPSTAPADSVRGSVYNNWESLGLSAQPDTGDNGVHASASPYEALAERLNWLGADLTSDAFGRALLNAGVPEQFVRDGGVDPQVCVDASGTKGSLFDFLEDINADECVAKLCDLVSFQGTN